ncbi:MAG: hypothetical protein EBR82_42120 [Caulobacteraceae bacterium]|nr:hypothetical protein [Caulobacteraceae bacterium]
MEEEDLVFQLDFFDDDEQSGMSALSFVKSPATQIEFEYFASQQRSFTDYPKEAQAGACKVLEWIDKYGRDEVDGMTQVGLQRANQLCKRKPISLETIARMASFQRHKKDSEINPEYAGKPWKDRGYVSWLGWGGDSGISWAQRKLELVANKMNNNNFSVISEEKRLVQAPVMVPDTKIVRFSNALGKYWATFSKDVIERMMKKYFIDGRANKVNRDHNPQSFVDDVYMVESYLTGDRNKSELFPDVPDGTWIATYFVKDDELWDQIKSGEYKGFSLEGGFFQTLEQQQVDKIYQTIKDILEKNLPDTEKEQMIKELLKIK